MESITDANNDIEKTERKNVLKVQTITSTSSRHHTPLFSDNFCRMHCLMTKLMIYTHLQGKQLLNIVTKGLHMHITVSEFLIELHCLVAGCSILHL